MKFLCISSMEKKKSEDESICNPSRFPILPLFSRKTLKRGINQSPLKKEKLHKLRFLQNLGCQEPCLDSSSMENKQVAQQTVLQGKVWRCCSVAEVKQIKDAYMEVNWTGHSKYWVLKEISPNTACKLTSLCSVVTILFLWVMASERVLLVLLQHESFLLIFTESQELGTLSRHHNSCLFACPSPAKRLRDFIIN